MKALVNYFLFVWMVAALGAWVSICCGGAAYLVVCMQRRGFEGGTLPFFAAGVALLAAACFFGSKTIVVEAARLVR